MGEWVNDIRRGAKKVSSSTDATTALFCLYYHLYYDVCALWLFDVHYQVRDLFKPRDSSLYKLDLYRLR